MSPARVTLVTQIFPPESNAGANRAGAAAAALADVGTLRVCTLAPSYPSPDYHRAHGTLYGHDESLPYEVKRSGYFHPHKGHFVLRALRESIMAVRLVWNAMTSPLDVLVATSPSIFVGLAAAAGSVIRRVPLVIDLRDLTWEYLADDARRRGSRSLAVLARVLRASARASLRRAALVAVSNKGIRAEVESMGIAPERIIDTPNGVSTELLDKGLALPDPDESPGRFVVTYAGALGYYQGIATLIEVAASMPGVEFRIIGDGPERGSMEETVAGLGLTNVLFTGYVDRDELYRHYGETDVLFAQLRDLPILGSATFPSKPYEFMATGRPIVYAGRGITAEFLEETGSALLAAPEDAESITRALQSLVESPELRHRLGSAGRAGAPAFRREAIMAEFAAAVVRLAER